MPLFCSMMRHSYFYVIYTSFITKPHLNFVNMSKIENGQIYKNRPSKNIALYVKRGLDVCKPRIPHLPTVILACIYISVWVVHLLYVCCLSSLYTISSISLLFLGNFSLFIHLFTIQILTCNVKIICRSNPQG